jgi:hypothetical protein
MGYYKHFHSCNAADLTIKFKIVTKFISLMANYPSYKLIWHWG